EPPSRRDRSAQMAQIIPLHGAARGYRICPSPGLERENAALEQLVGPRDAPDAVVHLRRTVEGDDYVADRLDDRGRILFQQETRGQQGTADVQLLEAARQPEEVRVHQRLPAGEDDPSDPQRAQVLDVALELRR